MNNADWEHVQKEVCTQLEVGTSMGETELETMTRLIWRERQNNAMAIAQAVRTALDHERGVFAIKTNVLTWKLPLLSESISRAKIRNQQ